METNSRAQAPSKSRLRAASEPQIPELCGLRLADLSSNLIAFTSQSLSGRFCDARWWAAEPAVAAAVINPTPARRALASERLGTLLKAYSIYLDLWVADATGLVVAQGKPGGYCYLRKTSVGGEDWYRAAMEGRARSFFHGIDRPSAFGQTVATYAAPIREGSLHDGKIVGVLGLFFDWRKQSQALIDGVRIPPDQRPFTRCLIVDGQNRVLASTGERGVLSEKFPLRPDNAMSGYYSDGHGHLVGFARSVGGENTFGGWHGVIEQSLSVAEGPLRVSPRGFGAGKMIPVQSAS